MTRTRGGSSSNKAANTVAENRNVEADDQINANSSQETTTTSSSSSSSSSTADSSSTANSSVATTPNKKRHSDVDLVSPPVKIRYRKGDVAAENKLLLEIKDGEKRDWPAVLDAFKEYGWGHRKLSLLKARYKALKEGLYFWEEDDIDYLMKAVYETQRAFELRKWEEVSEKMVALGASSKFPGYVCERKHRAKNNVEMILKVPPEEVPVQTIESAEKGVVEG